MSLSILGLHYKVLQLFHEFLQSSADSPHSLLLSRPLIYQNFITALENYSKQSKEIDLMLELFYLKRFNRDSIKFFLFFRDLVNSLRAYEIRETEFLEQISLNLVQWPQILKCLCAWDKRFMENIKEIRHGFEELYKEENSKFHKPSNSIKSLDLLKLGFKLLNPQKKDNKKRDIGTEEISPAKLFDSPNKNLNFQSRIFAKEKHVIFSPDRKKENNELKKENLKEDSNAKNFKKKLNEENYDLQTSISSEKIKLNFNATEKKINFEGIEKTLKKNDLNGKQKKMEKNEKNLKNENINKQKKFITMDSFIKPPKIYYKHLLQGCSNV